MKVRKISLIFLLLCFILISCSTFDIGQKPIVTMEDVKALPLIDVANLAKTLYNAQADWYKDRISRWDTLTLSHQEQARADYKLLCSSWPNIAIYDKLTKSNQPIDTELKTEIYRFIELHLGGN